MAGLYQRVVGPNTASPAMRVAVSPGAAGGIPRGGSASLPRQNQGLDAEKLGGLLGMIRNRAGGGSEGGSEGVFNASVMPGAGQGLASPVSAQAADTAAMLRGSPVDAASRMAEGAAANLPLPAMAGSAGSGLARAGQSGAGSALNLTFDPSRLGGMLGVLGFGG